MTPDIHCSRHVLEDAVFPCARSRSHIPVNPRCAKVDCQGALTASTSNFSLKRTARPVAWTSSSDRLRNPTQMQLRAASRGWHSYSALRAPRNSAQSHPRTDCASPNVWPRPTTAQAQNIAVEPALGLAMRTRSKISSIVPMISPREKAITSRRPDFERADNRIRFR